MTDSLINSIRFPPINPPEPRRYPIPRIAGPVIRPRSEHHRPLYPSRPCGTVSSASKPSGGNLRPRMVLMPTRMPEIAIHKNGDFLTRQNDIRHPRKPPPVLAVAQATMPELLAEHYFRPGIRTPDPFHILMALGWSHHIHRSFFLSSQFCISVFIPHIIATILLNIQNSQTTDHLRQTPASSRPP